MPGEAGGEAGRRVGCGAGSSPCMAWSHGQRGTGRGWGRVRGARISASCAGGSVVQDDQPRGENMGCARMRPGCGEEVRGRPGRRWRGLHVMCSSGRLVRPITGEARGEDSQPGPSRDFSREGMGMGTRASPSSRMGRACRRPAGAALHDDHGGPDPPLPGPADSISGAVADRAGPTPYGTAESHTIRPLGTFSSRRAPGGRVPSPPSPFPPG